MTSVEFNYAKPNNAKFNNAKPYNAKPNNAKLAAKSLPIWARIIQYYPFLRNVLYAQQFCVILLKQTVILGTTIEEREKILVVAMGGEWI